VLNDFILLILLFVFWIHP